MIIPGLVVHERRQSHVLQLPLAAPRSGIMLHYDDSSRDDWAVEWFSDPRCTNGYTWLILDNGRVVELADPGCRTPHAGACITRLANSRYYGLAIATNGLVPATSPQIGSMIAICVAVARHHNWDEGSIPWRIVGHDEEAVWTKASTSDRARWGRLGRKVDPTGVRPDGGRIVDVVEVRLAVQAGLK